MTSLRARGAGSSVDVCLWIVCVSTVFIFSQVVPKEGIKNLMIVSFAWRQTLYHYMSQVRRENLFFFFFYFFFFFFFFFLVEGGGVGEMGLAICEQLRHKNEANLYG